MTTISEDEYHLAHYGIRRRSGRYPWGSGGNENTRSKAFFDIVADLRAKGLTDTEIARGFASIESIEKGKPDFTTTDLRATTSIAGNVRKQHDIAEAERLAAKGMSNVAIGKQMGRNESSIRALLAPGEKEKADNLQVIADMLRKNVDAKGYVDIGSGVENQLQLSRTRLDTAVAMLKADGYQVHRFKGDQLGTKFQTEYKVLAKPGTTQRDAWMNRNNLQQIMEYSVDSGRSFMGMLPPISVDSKRIAVKYAEDGGDKLDGMMYVRAGAKDLSMGASRYSQVRIAVDNTHFLKGVAMLSNDLPKGVDIMFHTAKAKADLGPDKLAAMKPMKTNRDGTIDWDNPFGSVVRQIGDLDIRGNLTKLTSAINKVNDEGDWGDWSDNLSSQFLSKQSHALARLQLDKAYQDKKADFDEIMALTNPTIKKKLLEKFSEDADASAVHLKAAALPRQGTHVILPLSSLKDNEVYAPNFNNGERVALVRYPHGGIFEIPELTVNNNHAPAIKAIGKNAPDAIGINEKVAKRLSGADFDGDTVLVIPNGSSRIKSAPALERLKDFDPQRDYKGYDGMPVMSPRKKQTEMGIVSNLITDMTIRGATFSEIAQAVRHSMVVIDAEKHKLDYRRSETDNGIPALKKKYQTPYQPSGRAGASTLLSRRKGDIAVPERKQGYRIDPKTGEKIYALTDRTRIERKVNKRTGVVTEKVVPRTTRSTKLAEAKDAHSLSSGTKMESIYADHSNRLKALANEARLASLNTPPLNWSASARIAYAPEVASLKSKLQIAKANRPLERQAQLLGAAYVSAKRAANPDMDAAELKKLKGQALTEARTRTGARKVPIDITPDEWIAIQAGAISNSQLIDILNNTDINKVKMLATPREQVLMTSSKASRARAMLDGGATQAEVAAALGVSLTTLKVSLSAG